MPRLVKLKQSFRSRKSGCLKSNVMMTFHDAYVWARSAGESDGRILTKGTLDPCLLKHSLQCDGECGLILSQPCTCKGMAQQPPPSHYGSPYGGGLSGFSSLSPTVLPESFWQIAKKMQE